MSASMAHLSNDGRDAAIHRLLNILERVDLGYDRYACAIRALNQEYTSAY